MLVAAAFVGVFALAGCAGSADEVSVVGTWGSPEKSGEPSLEFTDSGRYSGTDGCNTVGGDYTVDGTTVDLGAMFSTMMFCEGVDTWLVRGATAELDGDTLTIFDEDGERIGTLDRAE